jgi:hypothetical protein
MQAVNNLVESVVSAVTAPGKPIVEKPSDRAWWKSSVVYQGKVTVNYI